MKKILSSLLVAGMMAVPAVVSAQEAHSAKEWKPYGFAQVQAGAGTTFTNVRASKLLSPTATLGVGYMATPELGLRFNVNGMWSKGGFRNLDEKYSYKYVTGDFDLLFNMTNIFSKDKMLPVNVYLVTGIGIDYAWDNDIAKLDLTKVTEDHNSKWGNGLEQKDFWGTNFRVGVMADYRINNHWNVGAEVDMNAYGDDFNSKFDGKYTRDWMLTAQVSLTYKFWKGEKKVAEPVQRYVEPEQPKVVKTKIQLTEKNIDGQGNFKVAEYETASSESSKRMIENLSRQIQQECGQYIKDGGKVDIIFTGSADAIPVTSTIKYNGEDIHDVPVRVKGVPVAMTLTKEGGINTNEQLALARALKAKEYVYKSTPALNNMQTRNIYNVKVSDERGVEYRTVDVEFVFYGK